jgi:hypothetical protein
VARTTFHGSIYEFNQVSALKATPIFTQRNRQTKPVTRFNQYGFTAGGPILIPKIVNGRNRLFWFFAYEGIKQSEPEPTFSTVPTEAQRNGDFSALLNINNNYRIYDPATGRLENGRIVRDPFPGNIIPSNRISPHCEKHPGANPAAEYGRRRRRGWLQRDKQLLQQCSAFGRFLELPGPL